jgi:hypothetical protein
VPFLRDPLFFFPLDSSQPVFRHHPNSQSATSRTVEGAMSTLYELRTQTTTNWGVQAVASATEVFTHEATMATTQTLSTTFTARRHGSPDIASTVVDIIFNAQVDLPLTCDAIYDFNVTNHKIWNPGWKDWIRSVAAKSGHCRARGKLHAGHIW